jgi:GntR family transcriptional regulator
MSNYPFRRLQADLAKLIGSMPAESRLPSEPDLAVQLGVSRATLREAMRSFEGLGMIRRRQGVGTFVVAKVPVLDTGLEVLESIETLAQRVGSNLTRVERVIYTDARPIAYLVDTLPEEILAVGDLNESFTGSVLDILLRRGNLKLTHSRTEVSAVVATQELARAMQIQRDSILLFFSANLYSASGQVVDYSLSYFLPGYFKFHIVRRIG